MFSRKLLALLGIAVWIAVILTVSPRALPHRHSLVVVHADDAPIAGCRDLHVRFDHHDTVEQSEDLTITRTQAPTLRVEAEYNGGLQVQGGDGDAYSVTLCKAAEAGNDAQSLLSQIHLNFQNGELRVNGPSSHQHWSAYVLIRAPKNASLDLSAHNGPLSLSHVDGKLKVRTDNGPITVADCTGELDLSAQNGPVTLEGNSGKQYVRSENGPLTVSLKMPAWDGTGLDAHSTNGPLTLHVPSGYTSGVLLESSRGPFSCGAAACSEGRKTWDDDMKRIEFGSGPAIVRISTVNGPVTVH
jgi:hypothetical protein